MRMNNLAILTAILFTVVLIISGPRAWNNNTKSAGNAAVKDGAYISSDMQQITFVFDGMEYKVPMNAFSLEERNEILGSFFDSWMKEAEEGDSEAQLKIGYARYTGLGMLQDFTDAVKWFEMASAQGNVRAKFLLGVCKVEGQGTVCNRTEGIELLTSAAESGSQEAQNFLRRISDTTEVI